MLWDKVAASQLSPHIFACREVEELASSSPKVGRVWMPYKVNQVKFTAYQRDGACTRLWLSKGLTPDSHGHHR